MTKTDATPASSTLMDEIRQLAKTAQDGHRLPADMLGSKTLARQAALMVISRLRKFQVPDPAAEPVVFQRVADDPSHEQDVAEAMQTVPQPRRTFAELGQLVPKGFYATPSRTGHNDLDFWKVVHKGTKVFVNRWIGGAGSTHITNREAFRALIAITEFGVDKAGDLFADENTQCRDCGLPLTDEESRAARRGPVCRSK